MLKALKTEKLEKYEISAVYFKHFQQKIFSAFIYSQQFVYGCDTLKVLICGMRPIYVLL